MSVSGAFGLGAQAQTDGPVTAVTWDGDPPQSADLLTRMPRRGAPPSITEQDGREMAQTMNGFAPGQRYMLMVQTGNYIAQDGWVPYRDNPHDRTEATTLTEDISSEARTSIAVESMPYDLSDGHELIIQTGDPSNPPLERLPDTRTGDGRKYEGAIFAYVDGEVSQGDTTIPIDDGDGNPVTITASSGDRILSDFQSLWPTHAREEIRNSVQRFMTGFIDEGGQLDGVALDTELDIPANKGIKHDPRWGDASEGIDGVSFKERLSPYTIDDVINKTDSGNAREKWDKQVDHRIREHNLNDAVFEEIKKSYPNIVATDWNHSGISEANSFLNADGKDVWHPTIFGTHANYGLYASIRNLTLYKKRTGTRFNITRHDHEVLVWQVNFARRLHTENNGKVQPWVTYEELSDGFYNVNVSGTPYYEEYMRHIALHTDPDTPLLYFNPHGQGSSDDTQDLNVNSVLADVNQAVEGKSFTLHTTGEIGYLDDVIATAVDLPSKRVWRVTAKRTDPNDDRPITVNVSNGDQFTIPGGEAGAWYESGLNENPTFSVTHPPVENLYPSEDFQGLGTGTWTKTGSGGDVTITRNVTGPDGQNNAIEIDWQTYTFLWSPSVPVEPNTLYTMSFWAKGGSSFAVHPEVEEPRYVVATIGRGDYGSEWKRHRATFKTGSQDSSMVLRFRDTDSNVKVAKPMLNKNRVWGPHQTPDQQTGATQSISLQKGGNLVSTVVEPSDPNLETVFGDATSTLAQVETEDGQVFDPDTGTDEIGTWEAGKPYNVYAEDSTSFDVQGTVLDSASVSLEEGWNWLPYPDSTSVAIDQALEPIQNDLVMVKDETGRVYRPAQNTNQIGSLQPGTAYKILLETPVTLSYPLE